MTISPPEVMNALYRADFLSFCQKVFATVSGEGRLKTNWHHLAMGWKLEQVRSGANTRLIINLPPRNLKSIVCSIAWPAYLLGHNPRLNIVCVSYSNELSRKLANDCRAVMQSDWYQRAFPNTLLQRGNMGEMDFRTTVGGGRLSTSVGGTLTGRGGNIIILDDPIKPGDAMSETVRNYCLEWFRNTLLSRIDDKEKGGAIVLVMQRLHEDDLAGHLLEKGGWQNLCLPAVAEEDMLIEIGRDRLHTFRSGTALHPERESLRLLASLKRDIGSATFAAQYQQDPVPTEGLHVKRDWLRYYSVMPEKRKGDRIVQSWDTASKDGVFSDFSVCVTALIRKREIYILDVDRAKLQFPDLKRRVVELANRWNAHTLLIEDAASGQQLIQVLRAEKPPGVPRPIARKPEGDKITRFSAQSHRI
ncbi:MAG: terminase, partial [Pseudomonadota bacterium]